MSRSLKSNPNSCRVLVQEVVKREAPPLPRPNPNLANKPIILVLVGWKDFGED